ncbi:hypothetical protein FDP41_000573 [Naegleria fowleri]|uniref:Thioredoxin domain-containing protein n=1 Tax=Naegleria fowleri TaxID=5763 RepID=A0A6A5CDM6_NAEFO|nr:uncharacterized protein FDP41_000573 [Naegleria fowleri]KAF0984674.1 hypothetical protein FDP41_000573 [Naegleria fowleri]CAG4708626.1 unnamed protein product [Naegleria fowleri]
MSTANSSAATPPNNEPQQKVPIRWDSASTVRDALTSKSDMRMVVCCFAEPFSPISTTLARWFEEIRMGDSVTYTQIFILDPFENSQFASECGIKTSPAVVLFWDGKPVSIQRNGWDEDTKIVGVSTKENYINVIRLLREVGEEEKHPMILKVENL